MNFLSGGMVIAAALALAYGGILVWQEPSRLRTIVKTLSIGSLSLLCFRLGGPVMLTLALGLSAVGDAFLANRDERNFISGLAAFLLAHLAYTVLFLGNDMVGRGYSDPYRLVAAATLAAIAIAVFIRLWPHLGPMRLPVMAYVLAILAMGISVMFTQVDPLILAGALMFMASDIILSHEIFVWKEGMPVRRHSPWLIWGLYWSGQALIGWAILSAFQL